VRCSGEPAGQAERDFIASCASPGLGGRLAWRAFGHACGRPAPHGGSPGSGASAATCGCACCPTSCAS
jgi:hypothetical protein